MHDDIAEAVDRKFIAAPEALTEVANAEEPSFTKEELLPIMDAIFIQGYSTESFNLRSVPVVLRSRFDWEDRMIYKMLEKEPIKLQVTQTNELGRLLLASSVVSYGNTSFTVAETEDAEHFNQRVAFIKRLPSLVIALLGQRLEVLDNKVRYIHAHAHELLENF